MNPLDKITGVPTRADIAALLTSIGKPGENQDEKVEAVKALNINNIQGHDLSLTLPTYEAF